jgi:hypothetical protein
MHDQSATAGEPRAEVIGGLRQLADYLDQHPEVPVNEFGWSLLDFTRHDVDDTAGKAEVDQVAATLGVTVRDETPRGGHYRAVKAFGLVTYEFLHVTKRRQAASEALMSYSGCVTPDDDTPQAA